MKGEGKGGEEGEGRKGERERRKRQGGEGEGRGGEERGILEPAPSSRESQQNLKQKGKHNQLYLTSELVRERECTEPRVQSQKRPM